ncbi:hypothetical protein BGZ70_005031, partial [Mortierella alpina]
MPRTCIDLLHSVNRFSGDNPFAPLMQIVHGKGVYMRLTTKARGMCVLERMGSFVVPTSVDMIPSLLATIPTLSASK